MKKNVKIEFTENVKSVVSNVKIEYEFNDTDIVKSNEEILQESKDLYNEASAYSLLKTQQKGI